MTRRFPSHKLGPFTVALCAGLAFTTAIHAESWQSSQISAIGVIGPANSYPGTLLNNAGQIAGYVLAGGTAHAAMTGANGSGVIDLGSLRGDARAIGINDSGQVVGSSYAAGGQQHAFVTGANGMSMVDLGAPAGSGSASFATGINSAGQVVGYTYNQQAYSAFVTGANGAGMSALGSLGGASSFAYGINNVGQAIGTAMTSGGQFHAFITSANGATMTDIGTLGGIRSEAYGINDSGQVVGYANTAIINGFTQTHAFVTGANGSGMTDLGTFGGLTSVAYDINNSGRVVGYSIAANGQAHAFISNTDGTGILDLNSLVNLGDGGYLMSAIAINDAGQILAQGSLGNYLLTPSSNLGDGSTAPIPEPNTYAMLLAGLGLLGVLSRRHKGGRSHTGETQCA